MSPQSGDQDNKSRITRDRYVRFRESRGLKRPRLLDRRRGKNVWAVSWFHDGSGTGKDTLGWGNNWVIAGILVELPLVSRPVCLPVLARLVVKDTTSASR
ncbi:MAG: hypothetical protein LC808_37855 [Actinobacteria bacterium]|nr:hypothetical protein [Actinomycetota bacterium]